MKVVITANTAWYLFNFRKNFIEKLSSNGYEVVCIAGFDGYEKKFSNTRVVFFDVPVKGASTNLFQEIRSFFGLLRRIKYEHPDLLCSFTLKQNLYAGLATKILGVRFIPNISGLGQLFTGSNRFIIKIKRKIFRFCVSHSQHIFFQNKEDLNSMSDFNSFIGNAMCSRIPGSGVDRNRFRTAVKPIRDQKIIFLMFSRFLPAKGFDLYLQAASRFLKKNPLKFEFQVMGRVDLDRKESTNLFNRLKLAAEQGLITLLPWSDKVEDVLAQVDVVVLPTFYNEGVPRSLLEALASGKTIIASDWKGVRDTVDHGENGFLVAPRDPESLFTAFQRVAALDEHERSAFSMASLKKAELEFDEDLVFDAYFAMISKNPQ